MRYGHTRSFKVIKILHIESPYAISYWSTICPSSIDSGISQSYHNHKHICKAP